MNDKLIEIRARAIYPILLPLMGRCKTGEIKAKAEEIIKAEIEAEQAAGYRVVPLKCESCNGTGKRNDASPYDMGYFNEWECEDCKGTGRKIDAAGGDEHERD